MKMVKMESQNGIGVITMNNPKTMNGLDAPLTTDLFEALKQFGQDETISVIMLAGEGKGFCGGGNVAEMYERVKSGTVVDESFAEDVSRLGEVAKYIRNVPKPVIAVVHGAAAGAGASLVMACDFAIAEENTKIIQAFVNVGLVPDTAGLFFQIRALGYKRATELSMLGSPMSAQEALAVGMVNMVVPADQLWDAANKLASKLMKKPKESIANIKRMVNQVMMPGIDEYLALEKECMMRCGETANFAEGVSAFIEKRKPSFNQK